MFRFNQLLRAQEIDPGVVRLIRHRDTRNAGAVFDAAMKGDLRFDAYQEGQVTPQVIEQIRAARYVASFVVDPLTKQTVFAGVWERLGERAAPIADPFRVGDVPRESSVAFETRRVGVYERYRGRIVIEWGDGTRAWVQRADRQDKEILELRKAFVPSAFPGFAEFSSSLSDVTLVPPSWSEALRTARGVYLLVHRSGAQYVGAAYGEGGFLGRWRAYASGHGGNVALRELDGSAEDYSVSILETVGSQATEDDVVAIEARWKKKLGSRIHGLNRN